MNLVAVGTLLQLVASLLTGAGHGQMSEAVKTQIIAVASNAIQLSDQAMAHINAPIQKIPGTWITAGDLYGAPYLDLSGNYVELGSSVKFIEEDTSFGDMNNDNDTFDDAAVVVERRDVDGNATFALAAMLNQGGMLFNVADISLGKDVQVYSHRIMEGGNVVINMQTANGPRTTSTYKLLGNQLIKL